MSISVKSAANIGLKSVGIDVEVNISSKGLPCFDIVGLGDKSVTESRHRVRTAVLNCGIDFPLDKRVTVNLAPADLPKEGSFYDLPIAVGVICTLLNLSIPQNALFFGELSLNGSLRHTKGILLFTLFARDAGFEYIYVPAESANEAAVVTGIKVIPVDSLLQLISHLKNESEIEAHPLINMKNLLSEGCHIEDNFCDVYGQEVAKRALEISAAGGHNVLMMGPPGAGKTMLAKAFPSILPPLTEKEALEVTKVYSVAGLIPSKGSLIFTRQCRSPHHTISYAGLIGGGVDLRPGEISLAHRGVLFLDEFAELPRSALEALRQPLENGDITISRSRGSVTFPSRFILLAASNPCPCGFANHPKKSCICTPKQVENYKKKLSGPILDRIDLHIWTKPIEADDLAKDKQSFEKSEVIKKRVVAAREIQEQRYKQEEFITNAELTNLAISKYCQMMPEAEILLHQAISKFTLSARAYFKLIRIARTISDLSRSDMICAEHLAEALQYRTF